MNLPQGWGEIPLEDIVTISSSKRIFHSDYVKSGIPFYRSKEIIEKQKGNNISTELFITEEKFYEIKNKFGVPQENDLLLTSVGTLGIPYLVKNNEVFYFKDGNLTWFREYRNLEPLFLYYFFLSPSGKERLNEITIGSTQSALTISGLKRIPISLPPLEEQKSIADTLSSFDDKIEFLQKQIETLEQILQSVFKNWFVDNIDEESERGMLGDFTNIKGGATPSTKNEKFWDGDIHWTSPKDLSNSKSTFLLNTSRKITDEGLKKVSSGLLPKGTLLLSSRAPIGYLAISNIDIAINQGYIAFLDNAYFSNTYMYFWLKTHMNLVLSAANGSTFQEISKTAFRQIECLVPNKETLQKFDTFAKPTLDKILLNLEEIKTLQKTRDTLLPKLMSGEVRVAL